MRASADVPILQGEEFKEVWEERLTPEAKRVVRRAVRRGDTLEDPGLASVAVSLARKYQRLPKPALLVGALLMAFWIWVFTWLLSLPAAGSVVLWRVLAAGWILMLPGRLGAFLFVQRPRYRKAETDNLLGSQRAKM